MASEEDIARLRRDVDLLLQVNAGLVDALKYLIRHGNDGADQAEEKRASAERQLLKLIQE